MCDYSLHAMKNRLAENGEELFVNVFKTGCKGLAAVSEWAPVRLGWLKRRANEVWSGAFVDPAHTLTAVCVPPGARLRVRGIPTGTRQELGVREVEDVTFYTDLDRDGYRDGLKFSNGRFQLLQLFHEGLRVEVLSVELEERKETERKVSANA